MGRRGRGVERGEREDTAGGWEWGEVGERKRGDEAGLKEEGGKK